MKKYVVLAVVALLSIPALSLASLTGDLNQDHTVDNADFLILQGQFGQCGEGLSADLNNDGCVDTTDFNILAANFGATEPIPVVVSGGQGFSGTGTGCIQFIEGTTIYSPCHWDAIFAFSGIHPCMFGDLFSFMTGQKCDVNY